MRCLIPHNRSAELIDDADISVVNGEYRELVELPGYGLRKGVEVTLFEERDGQSGVMYRAVHDLPSCVGNAVGMSVEGRGATEDEAGRNLGSKLAEIYKAYRSRESVLPPDAEMQGRYLDTILFVPHDQNSLKGFDW
ncbi:hypothetical protein J4460_07490 [Candidatus Woesearchaeota archaeon]|nr:hypothetical protein [Candidatus Woesearchaeota archaeon]HIH37756.1 hypothetical protein [Candidatus Woesearchaeota archaeon]HIH48933.1 hypothetical protein [Candidatus Woesearchaeota archaeon]HIJ02708.1 hypothetical protein [Candidatus Woesearchaeota archaeon]